MGGQLSERWDRAFNPDRYGTGGRPLAGADQQEGARMNLASAGSSGSGGGGTHKATTAPWTEASGVAGELHRDMQAAIKALGEAHEGFKDGTAGLASAAALGSIRSGWDERLAGVRDRCEYLDGAMKKVGVDFHEHEVRTKKTFKK